MGYGISFYERKIILTAIVVAIIWAFMVNIFSDFIYSLDWFVQFFLVILFNAMLPGIVLGVGLGSDGVNAFVKAVGGMLFFLAYDLITPPLMIGLDGTFLGLNTVFSSASIDIFFGHIYQGIGVNGFPLFVLVYPVTFVLLITVSLYLLTRKNLLVMIFSRGLF